MRIFPGRVVEWVDCFGVCEDFRFILLKSFICRVDSIDALRNKLNALDEKLDSDQAAFKEVEHFDIRE